jgi:phosphatidylserine/phosphatidylglycerophosphate/cardiolipin synthase-like enzyme
MSFAFTNINQNSIDITFAPHKSKDAEMILNRVAQSINNASGSVFFSVMQIDRSGGPVMPALKNIQKNTSIFSYGISDQVDAVSLYKPGSRRGILVNAKSLSKVLPPPFKLEADYNAHKIHHKSIVTDFNTPQATVYFGSSNLALGGEQSNGDNLVCVKDQDIATVFAIEALRLVDHFHFRAVKYDKKGKSKPLALKKNNKWAKAYYNPSDIRYIDRKLFA